jgi:hypothetical protein
VSENKDPFFGAKKRFVSFFLKKRGREFSLAVTMNRHCLVTYYYYISSGFFPAQACINYRVDSKPGGVSSHPGLPDGMNIFKPKIPIWVKFGGSCNGRC